MANTPVIGRMKLTSGNYVYFKDIDARTDISSLSGDIDDLAAELRGDVSAIIGDIQDLQSAVDQLNSFEYSVCTNAANTPQGVKWGDPEITGTLVASDSTMYKIYLVPSENAQGDIYDEYITIRTGSGTYTYTWEKLGDTSVNLDALGDMAYCDTASATYTPAGTISGTDFTGSPSTVSVKNTAAVAVTISKAASGTANYTPAGTVSAPTFTGTESSISLQGSVTPGDITIIAGEGPNYTPEGTISAPSFTGTAKYIGGEFTPTGKYISGTFTGSASGLKASFSGTSEQAVSVKGTPAGSVSVGADKVGGQVVKTVTGNTGSIATFGTQGTLPTLTTSVGTGDDAETLIFTFTQGTLPTAGSATVVTSVSSTAGDLSFSGTETTSSGKFTPGGSVTLTTGTGSGYTSITPAGTINLTTGDTAAEGWTDITATGSIALTAYSASGTGRANITPAGSVSAPTFTGTTQQFSATAGNDWSAEVGGLFTPAGTVSAPTFTGTGAHLDGSIAANSITSEGAFTPEGTVGDGTFTGTAATITVTPDN